MQLMLALVLGTLPWGTGRGKDSGPWLAVALAALAVALLLLLVSDDDGMGAAPST